jgi:hypothetical protein
MASAAFSIALAMVFRGSVAVSGAFAAAVVMAGSFVRCQM